VSGVAPDTTNLVAISPKNPYIIFVENRFPPKADPPVIMAETYNIIKEDL